MDSERQNEQEYEKFNEDVEVLANHLTNLNAKVKEAYEKSCKGDWSCLKDLEFLKWIGCFYTHWAINEALTLNLLNYAEENSREEGS